MQELFTKQAQVYNLRNNRDWEVPYAKTVAYGIETIRYRGPNIWELLPSNIKDAKTLDVFKAKIKDWKPKGCTCRLSQLCLPCRVSLNKYLLFYLLRIYVLFLL